MPKYQSWTEEMANSLDFVRSGESEKEASKKYSGPRTTLQDKLHLDE